MAEVGEIVEEVEDADAEIRTGLDRVIAGSSKVFAWAIFAAFLITVVEVVALARSGGSLNHLLEKNAEKYEGQIQRRYAVPFAPIVFALLAVPLSAIRMRGARAWGALLSALLVGGYYGMVGFSEYLAEVGVPAVAALWLPNLCFATTGILLLLRMRRVPR